MKIELWPRHERPREKMQELGSQALSNVELVALLIGSGSTVRNAVELAHDLLVDLGGLRGVLDARDLPPRRGIGPVKAGRIAAAFELARRCLAEELRGEGALLDPIASVTYLHARLSHYPYEVFCALFLDARNRMIAFEEMFRGTFNGATVHVREVVRSCIRHNAASIIFAHNHPSGTAEPSEEDRAVTVHLRHALALIDVRLLDHFVIGNGAVVSMAERGWI
jgi:DNA repair protein RadC